MSYRTYVNGHQIFGNNECYPEWIEFVKTQGAEPTEDDAYSCDITDFDGAMLACEAIAIRLAKEHNEERPKRLAAIDEILKDDPGDKIMLRLRAQWEHSLFAFPETEKAVLEGKDSLFDALHSIVYNSYMFLPMALFLYCQELLEDDEIMETEQGVSRIYRYKLKPGAAIHVSAG